MGSVLTEEEAQKYFLKHQVIEYQAFGEGKDRVEKMIWGEPGTGINKIQYITYRGHLFVSGDLESAVYHWYDDISLVSICKFNLFYFASKCEASPCGRGYRIWFESICQENAKNYFENSDEDALKNKFEEDGGWSHMENQSDWVDFIRDDKYFSDSWENFDWGMHPDNTCFLHLVGIRMAMKWIEKNTPELWAKWH